MSRLIIDNNQISDVAATGREISERLATRGTALVLTPDVLAEARCCVDDKLARLIAFPIQFGWDGEQFWTMVALADLGRVPFLSPVSSCDTKYHATALAELNQSGRLVEHRARLRKEHNKTALKATEVELRKLRKLRRDTRSRGVLDTPLGKFTDFAGAYELLYDSTRRKLEAILASRGLDTDPVAVAHRAGIALKSNAHIARYFRLDVCATVAWAGLWQNPKLNASVTGNRDDLTDIRLGLYASDGDVVLTEDKLLRDWIEAVEPHNHVVAMTWKEYLETQRLV